MRKKRFEAANLVIIICLFGYCLSAESGAAAAGASRFPQKRCPMVALGALGVPLGAVALGLDSKWNLGSKSYVARLAPVLRLVSGACPPVLVPFLSGKGHQARSCQRFGVFERGSTSPGYTFVSA